jgi:hypothetical protein
VGGVELVEPEDHTVLLEPSSSRRVPELVSTSTPVVSVRGWSRLATQQMAMASGDGEKKNHVPRYRLVGSPGGEKNPSVNEPPAETRVLPSVRLPPVYIMSEAGVPGERVNSDNTMWTPIRRRWSRCLRIDIFWEC